MNRVPPNNIREIKNLKDMINESVDIYGDKTAFLRKLGSDQEYQAITYNKLKEDIDSLGTKLTNLGLKDKRIAVIGENRYEWAVGYLTVVNGVGGVVPLDRELPQNEIESLIIRSKASAVIFSDKVKEKIQAIKENLKDVEYFIDMDIEGHDDEYKSLSKLIEEGKELIKKGDISYTNSSIDEEEIKIILFTSGTTDLSKAVMLSHKNLCTNIMDMSSYVYFDSNDTFLSVLPIHHTYECTCGFLCALYRGATIAYCEGLRHIAKNLKEAKVTVMLGVPLIFESMYKKIWESAAKSGLDKKLKTGIKISNALKLVGIDASKKIFKSLHENFGGKLRLLVSGAAAIDPKVSKGFRNLGIAFLQGYGLTECSPILTVNKNDKFKDASAGLPLPHVNLKIDNPNQDGIGEIIAQGDNVMHGYYENQEATDKILIDGWFYTGDLGYLDKEGFLYITGRKKDVIITKNGKNIYPEEIELLLNRSPYIKECMIYAKNDSKGDDIVAAAIIVPELEEFEIQFGEVSDEKIKETIADEVKKVNKGLVLYKYIRDFKIQKDEFIKTTTKKIKRHMVEKQ